MPAPSTGERYRTLVAESPMLAGDRDAVLASNVTVTDATPSLGDLLVSARHIKIGDAALSIDPLSSSGLQKAIRSAMAGAVVVNTLLRRPELAGAACRYHEESSASSFAEQISYAASHHAVVAARHPTPFWLARSTGPAPNQAPVVSPPSGQVDAPLRVSPAAWLADVPVLEDTYVALRPALHHPNLARPVAFIDGIAIAPLLDGVTPGASGARLMQHWSQSIPGPSAGRILNWLRANAVLVAA